MKRKDTPPGATPLNDSADGVAEARTRARQRLIGAVVLVAAGIIGFPLVFETQPRPVPVDIPIAIPRKDGAAPLVMPPAPVHVPASAVPEPVSPTDADIITETRADAGRDMPLAPRPAASEHAATDPKSDTRTDARLAATAPNPAPVQAPPKTSADAPAATDGARAEALLEGRDAGKTAADARFIVQVGAFSEAVAAREARLKVEKLGLKTYTQVAETPGGSRIRVRVGPFASRDDADKALAKARAAGLGGVVLVL